MQSEQYKVEVFEFPEYNSRDNSKPNRIMNSQKFTWGYYELQYDIRSYKMDVPSIYDEIHFGKTIIYSPIITLIDNENNYYNFKDLEIEDLPYKRYKIIIIQISHIPIKYNLKRDIDGNLNGNELVEYYDNNGQEVHATEEYYTDVYQIKIENIDVLVLMCDTKYSFETQDQYYFYSSVIYLPAYTIDRQILKRFTEYSIPYDQEDMYVNNDPDTQLEFKYLHRFSPKKVYYYYEFYGITEDTIEDDEDADNYGLKDGYDLNGNKVIKNLIDFVTLRYSKAISKLELKISQMNKSNDYYNESYYNDLVALKDALKKQSEEEHKPPNKRMPHYLNKIKELKTKIRNNKLQVIKLYDDNDIHYVATFSEENELGDINIYTHFQHYIVDDVLASIRIRGTKVQLNTPFGYKTVLTHSTNISKKRYYAMYIEDLNSAETNKSDFLNSGDIFYSLTPKPVTIMCTDNNGYMKRFDFDATDTYVNLDNPCIMKILYILNGYGVRFNNDPEIFKNHRTEINQEINKIHVFTLYDNNENAYNDDNNEKANLNKEINPDLREVITDKEVEREEERMIIEQIEANKEEERKQKEREEAEQQQKERKRIEIEAERKIKEVEEKRKNKEIEENKEKEEVFWFNIKIGVIFLLSILLIFVIIKTRRFS